MVKQKSFTFRQESKLRFAYLQQAFRVLKSHWRARGHWQVQITMQICSTMCLL